MIKVYKNKIEESTKIQQGMTISENGIKLELLLETIQNDRETFTLKYDDIEPNLKYAILFSHEGYSPFIVDESHDIFSSDSAAIFIFKSDSGDINIQCRLDTQIADDSCKYEEAENIPNFRVEMRKLYSTYAVHTDKMFYHNAFIEALNNKTTLAYLDAQVELMSSILLKILDKHSELISDIDIDFIPIKTAFENTSLLNIKDIDKVLDEINTNKQYVRKLQKKYYELKNSKNNDSTVE